MKGIEKKFALLLQEIHARAAACTTARELEVLRDSVPNRSSAWEIYKELCREFGMRESLAKANACKTLDELERWEKMAPVSILGSDKIDKIYRRRKDELLYPDAIKEAAACRTIEEVDALVEYASVHSGKQVIYEDRRKEILIADAIVKASACTTSQQAGSLYWRYRDFYGISEINEVHRNRQIELANAEAPAKAAACKEAKEAKGLFYGAIDGTLAKKIYEILCMELC